MVIETKEQIDDLIHKDIEAYKQLGYKNSLVSFIMQNDVGKLMKFMRALRREEYWTYCAKKVFFKK